MTAKIQFSFIQLDQITSSIKNGKLSDISKIEEKLKLERHLPISFSPFTERLRGDLLQTLQDLDKELSILSGKGEDIQELRKQVSRIRKALEATPILSEKKLELLPPIKLTIGFFCDIDVPDYNDAITARMRLSIKESLPFITTRSLLRGTGICWPNSMRSIASQAEHALLEKRDEYEIFQHSDPEFGEELLVFLPKSLVPGKSGKEKLDALDFMTDGSLKQISLLEALQEPTRKNDLRAFFKLFRDHPRIDKLFYLAGHGGAISVGGLRGENYKKFVDFLGQQRCRGFLITSCCSGGKSFLMHFSSKELSPSFPILVRSLGDFPTHGDQSENDLKNFYESWIKLISDDFPTISSYQKIVNQVEQGKRKELQNLMKIYLPPSGDSLGVLMPLQENESGFACTYQKAKQSELASQKPFSTKDPIPTSDIKVKNKEIFLVHPLVTSAPVVFTKRDPQLVSMLPGQGHHFLQSVKLAEETGESFLNKTIRFHELRELQVPKGFFIGKLHIRETVYEEVVLHLTPNGAQCVYREGNQYFFTNGSAPQLITAFQHALIFQEVRKATTAEERAIQITSAGYEEEKDFIEATSGEQFWDRRFSEGKEWAFSIPQSLEKIDNQLSAKDKEELVFYLLASGFGKEAFEIFKREKLNPNLKSLKGVSILSQALTYFEMAEYLIQEGASVNVPNPWEGGNYPLHQVVERGDLKGLEWLIAQPDLDLEGKNTLQWTAIFYAFHHPAIFQKLIEKGANINALGKEGKSILSHCLLKNKFKTAEAMALLEAGADPNVGLPSPLLAAIYTLQTDLVKKCLEKGGKPFDPARGGQVPFVEACLRGSLDVVLLLLERDDCNLEVEDESGMTPIVAALFSGNREKIKALQEKGALFPKSMSYSCGSAVDEVLNRWHVLGDVTSLKELLQWNHSHSQQLEYYIGEYLLKRDPKLLGEFIEEGLLDPNAQDERKNSIFFTIAEAALEDFTQYKPFLELCLKKGAKFQQPSEEDSLLKRTRNPDYIKWLLENGYLISPEEFEVLIFFGNLELVQLAVLNGANIHGEKKKMLPLQVAAKLLQDEPEGKIFKWLLEQGADLNIEGENDKTPFCEVMENGDLAFVEYCLDHGADLKGTLSPLLFAARLKNDPEGRIFKLLIGKGGDMNAAVQGPFVTPFSRLVKYGNEKLIEWALENKALVNPLYMPGKKTPLKAAAERKDGDAVLKRLLQEGATAETPERQEEVLLAAFKVGNAPVVQLLLDRGYGASPTSFTGDLIYKAYLKGGVALLKKILELKVNIGALKDAERKRLWKAIIHEKDVESLKQLSPHLKQDLKKIQIVALKENKIAILRALEELDTPLEISAIQESQWRNFVLNEQLSILKLLKEKGLDFSKEPGTLLGQKLLEIALTQSWDGLPRKTIRYLIENEVKVTNYWCHETTPFIYAAVDKEDPEVVKILLNAGAGSEIDLRNKGTEKSSLDLARDRGNREILALLKT